jgi:hypothetical protein
VADEATGEPARTDGDRQAERDRMCEEQLAAPSDRRVPVVDARVLRRWARAARRSSSTPGARLRRRAARDRARAV